MSECHLISALFYSFKTVGNILDNAGAVSIWWLWCLFWCFLYFVVFLRGFGYFVWLALYYLRFALENWILYYIDVLF